MKFISLSSPGYSVAWQKANGLDGFYIAGQLVMVSEIAPVVFYIVKQEIRPYKYVPLYQGTDHAEAQRVLGSVGGPVKAKLEISKGLPDFKFSIDRSMGEPVYVTAHENDANGCLLEASVLGSYGFKASGEAEILAKYRTEGKVHENETWFSTISVLLPGQSLIMEFSRKNGECSRIRYVWDGRLLTVADTHVQLDVAHVASGPWGALEKLQLK